MCLVNDKVLDSCLSFLQCPAALASLCSARLWACLVSLSSIALCELRRKETEIKIVPLAVFSIWAFSHPFTGRLKSNY